MLCRDNRKYEATFWPRLWSRSSPDMPRRLIRRYLPDRQTIREQRALRLFGDLLHDPNLWHLNRRSVSLAAFVGIGCAFVPIPIQMALAGLLSIWLRCNLPVAVALVWISNPLTFAPIFYFAYWVGAGLLGVGGSAPLSEGDFNRLAGMWEPFLVGCLVSGVTLGAIGAFAVQTLWRIAVLWRWRKRRARRAHSDS